jgi:dCTP deaminase
MILGGLEIKRLVDRREIVISPFDERHLGPNSYDVHLGDKLMRYDLGGNILDPENLPPLVEATRHKDKGWFLEPGVLYLGNTVEYTETTNLVPMIEGRSSIGRLGVSIHATAGFGDVGFCGRWTLEISVVMPVFLKPGVKIGQIYYLAIQGAYSQYAGRYQGQDAPTSSRLCLEPSKKA